MEKLLIILFTLGFLILGTILLIYLTYLALRDAYNSYQIWKIKDQMENDYNKFWDSCQKILQNYKSTYYNNIMPLSRNIIGNLKKELNPDNLIYSECNKLIMNNKLNNINKIFKNKISQYSILAECCEIIDSIISYYKNFTKFIVSSCTIINQERKNEIFNTNEIHKLTNKYYKDDILNEIKNQCTLLNIIYELYKKDQGNQKVEELFKDKNDLTAEQLSKLNTEEFSKLSHEKKCRELNKFNDFVLKNCGIDLSSIKIQTDKQFHIESKATNPEINLTSTTEAVKKDEKVNPNQLN